MHVEIKELVLRYDTSRNSEHGSGWRHSTKVSIQSLFKCSLNTLRLQIDSFHASGGRLLLEGRAYFSHNICTVQPAGDCVYTYPYLGAFAPPTARSCRAKTNSNMWNRPTLEPWHQTHPGKPECQAPWEVQSNSFQHSQDGRNNCRFKLITNIKLTAVELITCQAVSLDLGLSPDSNNTLTK